MSHGGFGGGGHGHGGHHGGGHHGHHGGGAFGHSAAGHHGTIIGHILHSLGIHHHHLGHHHHGGMHHPDQAPTWNQALQGGTFWQKVLKIDKRPFAILFLMFFSSFCWLYIIYKLHHAETAHERAASLAAQQERSSLPSVACAPQAGAALQAAAANGYAPQTAAPIGQPGYVAQAAASNALAPAWGTYGQPAQAAALPQVAGGSMPAAGNAYGCGATTCGAASVGMGSAAFAAGSYAIPSGFSEGRSRESTAAISAPRTYRHALGGLNTYEPLSNGRQRMVVTR